MTFTVRMYLLWIANNGYDHEVSQFKGPGHFCLVLYHLCVSETPAAAPAGKSASVTAAPSDASAAAVAHARLILNEFYFCKNYRIGIHYW